MIRIALIFALVVVWTAEIYAACGANTRTWQADGGTTTWTTNNNWNPRNYPNSATENAYIRSDWTIPQYPNSNYTLGCLEINSGSMTAGTGTRTLTIVGDYFRNLNPGSLIVPSGSRWTVSMAGTAAQTFENVDSLPRLTINNGTTVTLTESFTVTGRFTISSGTGTVYIDKSVLIDSSANTVNIPSSATLVVRSGAILTLMNGATVDGILKIEAGGKVVIGGGSSLQINSGGILQLAGNYGNIASIDSDQGGNTYTLSIAGSLNANYFSIGRMNAEWYQCNW